MVYMFVENPFEKRNLDFLRNDRTRKIEVIAPSQKCNSKKDIFNACKEILRQTNQDDLVIFWYDFIGVVFWWMCFLLRKSRNVIIINVLLKDKKSFKNKFAKFLYKLMLKSKKVQATVTSKKYGEHLNEMLGIQKQYTLLHDIYRDGYSIDYKGKVNSNTVFCGGRNGRDWDFLIQIAQVMPEVTFNCVMPKDKFEEYKENFGKNMAVKSDIPEQEFLEFMCQSQLVVTPLDTEAPAGLIAFYQAAANGKMAITSDTVTTQEYFADGRGTLCGRNVEDWKNTIQYFLKHREEADSSAEKFKRFLENECSEEKYAKTLWGMLAEHR